MDERRRQPRIEVMLTGSCDGATCQLKDISTSGVQFLAAQPFQAGDPAELTFQITLQVRWCDKIDEGTFAVGGEKGVAKWIPASDGGGQGET